MSKIEKSELVKQYPFSERVIRDVLDYVGMDVDAAVRVLNFAIAFGFSPYGLMDAMFVLREEKNHG